MAEIMKLKKSADAGIKDILKYLLEKKKVTGAFLLKKTGAGSVHYSLVTNNDEMERSVPFAPVMPENAARMLTIFMKQKPPGEPLAVVVRPCELRALVELSKLGQVDLSQLFVISVSCPGVYPIKTYLKAEKPDELDAAYKKSAANGEIQKDLRATCNACEHFLPIGADITVLLVGKDMDSACDIVMNTEKARDYLSGMELKKAEEDTESKAVVSLRKKRDAEREKLFSSLPLPDAGMDGLIQVLGKCIQCYGCRSVCPICYCTLCYFDSANNESPAPISENEAGKRGAVKVPSDTLFYHLGRITHIGISCVGCGACSDVCPAEIPLPALYYRSGKMIQDMFEYTPGKNRDEERPLSVFKEEELGEYEH
ncbi:MAG: Coenzyme F420 hydrogenase/dehydrogenase, beta subunit C-terminal domain [Spirochaetales bacterium]|nr:Coenzyme F420 hydrogenase/dehydrogenase, beta subunit C-terminal domain [Spirochaetales bacterium]